MFGAFKKKTKIQKLIEQDGIERTTKIFSDMIIRDMLKTEDIAYQFILEEIEASNQGNEKAIEFAKKIGISPEEYIGAMKHSRPEVDGANGPQQYLFSICTQLNSNIDLMVEFRIRIINNIMVHFCFGIYDEDNSWVDILIKWANENNLKEPYNTMSGRAGFPRDRKEIKNLEYLCLLNSNISYLPVELGNLKKLHTISLDGNSIEHYPKEMCNFKKLIKLDLDNNNISYLPKEIGNLSSLKILLLKNNKIKDFPIEMNNLQNISKLDLREQPIHLSSTYSPLSEEGLRVLNYFHAVIKEDSIDMWLKGTDTSNLKENTIEF